MAKEQCRRKSVAATVLQVFLVAQWLGKRWQALRKYRPIHVQAIPDNRTENSLLPVTYFSRHRVRELSHLLES